ncbi:MAG: peptidoglycan-binding domain-containing protein [Hyphomicrobium sp.]
MNSKHPKFLNAMRSYILWFLQALSVFASSQIVLANDDNGIRFGPLGEGTASAGIVDREFIKNWESNPPLGYPTLSPSNIEATQKAIKKYQDIVANGGWETVPETKLVYGQTDSAVPILKSRLMVSGEYVEKSDASAYFDSDLENALKKFQATNGLTPTVHLHSRRRADQ